MVYQELEMQLGEVLLIGDTAVTVVELDGDQVLLKVDGPEIPENTMVSGVESMDHEEGSPRRPR